MPADRDDSLIFFFPRVETANVYRRHRLEKEEQGGNWLYTLDQISPIEI